MSTQESIVCRLCLKICDNFKAIEGFMQGALNKLLKINLAAVQDPVVCTNCEEIIIKCVDFKTTCFYTLDYIVPFINNKDTAKLDLKDVYLSKNEKGTDVPQDQVICAFCMKPVKNCSVISLDVDKADFMLKKMIEQCLPESDLSIIKEPVICAPCRGSLEKCFRFVANSLAVEERIKKYCETLDININSKSQIKLSVLLQCTIGDVIKREVDDNLVDIIKVEKRLSEETENADDGHDIFKLEKMSCVDSDNPEEEVEHKYDSYMDIDDLKFNNEQLTSKNMLACEEENDKLAVSKIEEMYVENEHKEVNPIEMEDQKLLLNEEIELKTDEPDFISVNDVGLLRRKVTTGLHREQECLVPEIQEDLSKPYNKQTLANKIATTTTRYQCPHCTYQTKNKYYLNLHLLKNKSSLEVTMHKCDCCSYQTEHKCSLKIHLLTHKDPSEETVYKCDSCLYQTKYKNYLKRHLLKHRDPLEITIHKCDSCLYQTKNKKHLKRHTLLHKNPSEVTLYKCASCTYQTKYKNYLRLHLRIHKDPSEVTMYKCDLCSFETKQKCNLKNHSLVHKNPSELRMFHCDACPFQTKQKYNLKKHMLIHMKPSEVTMYRCQFCSFQTKYSNGIRRHIIIKHKDSLR